VTASTRPVPREDSADLALADKLKVGREAIVAELRKLIVGQDDAIELALISLFTGGNSLIIGVPGLAKTLLVHTLAQVLDLKFSRIQFTPDLMPSDITGTDIIQEDPETGRRRLAFVPGPIFANIVLADEINRTPPKTQAALLEAMQERHVTVDGRTRWLPNPFLVIATQNPYEQEGVFDLPESQLDRFLFKAELGYGDEDEELRMLSIPHRGLMSDMLDDVVPRLDSLRLDRLQSELEQTQMPEDVGRAVIAVVRTTRERPGVLLGASPRAAIHLATAAKANARLSGRETVTIDDVARMARPVLAHRIVLESGTGEDVIYHAVEAVLRAPV
jgi:MoxR-like ATPase